MVRTPRLALGLTAALALSGSASGGQLAGIYAEVLAQDPGVAAARFKELAARQRIATARRGTRPKVSLHVRELWVDQTVEHDQIAVLREGNEGFANDRVNVNFDQPLFDATIRPRVRAAELAHTKQELMTRTASGRLVQRLIESYVDAAHQASHSRSLDRVVAHLEDELQAVEKRFKAKLATVVDVETVKLNLAAAQGERNVWLQNLDYQLLSLGVEPGTLVLKDLPASADISSLGKFEETRAENPEVAILAAEAEILEQERVGTLRLARPRLSLHGLYELDDADDSVFGGARQISAVEVGVAVRWDLFDRGESRSKAKEYEYEILAKKAERDAAAERTRRIARQSEQSLARIGQRVEHAQRLMEHQATILASVRRGHDAGTQSYVHVIEAFLLHESRIRDWNTARFNQLGNLVRFRGEATGWSQDLIAQVDALFDAGEPPAGGDGSGDGAED